jgi:hypothetical protein
VNEESVCSLDMSISSARFCPVNVPVEIMVDFIQWNGVQARPRNQFNRIRAGPGFTGSTRIL